MSSVSSSLFASTCASHSATNRHTFRNERAPQKMVHLTSACRDMQMLSLGMTFSHHAEKGRAKLADGIGHQLVERRES